MTNDELDRLAMGPALFVLLFENKLYQTKIIKLCCKYEYKINKIPFVITIAQMSVILIVIHNPKFVS